MINSSSNLVIGIAPDLKIVRETFKHVNKTDKPYLEFIKNNVDRSKILFDIDYSWNVDENNNLDTNFLERINQYFNEEQKELILSKNAINFF